jgi:hypothetical protein
MKRCPDRRLRKVEAQWFVSARVAAILRALDASPDAGELLRGMRGMFDPSTLSDRELDFLIAEFRRLIVAAGGAVQGIDSTIDPRS